MSTVAAIRKAFMTAMVAALVALFMLTACAGVAWGYQVEDMKTTTTMKTFYYPNYADGNTFDVWANDGKQFVKPKSNNKDVAVVKFSTSDKDELMVRFKKPGKATVTFKFEEKKYTIKCIVAKYTNPLKTFKIGSTNLTKRFQNKSTSLMKKGIPSGKVTVVPSAAWKIVRFEYHDESKGKVVKPKTIKKLSSDHQWLNVVVKHKKSGACLTLKLTAGDGN